MVKMKTKYIKPQIVLDAINKERKKKGFFTLSLGKIFWLILFCVVPASFWIANAYLVHQLGVQVIFGIIMIPMNIVWLFIAYFIASVFAWLCRKSFTMCILLTFIYITVTASTLGMFVLIYFVLNRFF